MLSKIVECIPNFSEARRPNVIASILEAIGHTPGVVILDHQSDLDHNRTVVTFIGSPAGVEEAAFRAVQTASQLIDLNFHRGAHPRIGATDVVPFVPLKNVAMQECVEIAVRLGQRVGSELDIPVYLYEEAATNEDRRNLENIRRGQFEALQLEIASEVNRKPDFGPLKMGPAGATVIGARELLIAFNVFLDSSDIAVARKIAKSIRYSSGGFRFVKAIGILVNGLSQVSMNLTNFSQTPIPQVFEAIREEAARDHVKIHHSELVGLVPLKAVTDTARFYIQMEQLSPSQILEQKVFENLGLIEPALVPHQDFLDRLAAFEPVPGGGAAAAHTGAVAAALVIKVAGLTIATGKNLAERDEMTLILNRAKTLQQLLLDDVEMDCKVMNEQIAAMIMTEETPKITTEIANVVQTTPPKSPKHLDTMRIPVQVAKKSAEVAGLALSLAEKGVISAISDAANAVILGVSASQAASLTARLNLPDLDDKGQATSIIAALQEIEIKISLISSKLGSILKERSNLQFPQK
jgi:glutamate formiminotransferase/formiminotetrahydrofolate cyclodeaminase